MPIETSEYEKDPKRYECDIQTQPNQTNQNFPTNHAPPVQQEPAQLSLLNVSAISYSSNGSSMASTSAGFSQYRDVDTESVFSKNSLCSKNKDNQNDYDDEDDNDYNINDSEHQMHPPLDGENFNLEENPQNEEDNSTDSTDSNRRASNETIDTTQPMNTSDSQLNTDNTNSAILEQSQQTTSNQSTLTATNASEDNADQSILSNSNYSRLTRTVRSYLNATNSISSEPSTATPTNSTIRPNQPSTLSQLENRYNNFSFSGSPSPLGSSNNSNSSSQLNLDKICSSASSKADFFNPTFGGPLKFEPKSSLFYDLLRKSNQHIAESKLAQAKTNITDVKILLKLANLYLAYENYYTAMFVPMNDNFKLNESNSNMNGLNRAQIDSRDDALNYLEKFSSSDFSFKRIKRTSHDDLSYNCDNELSFLIDSSNEIENFLNDLLESSSSKPENKEESSQNDNSNDKSCKSNEFHLCSLCCHCLVEPVTLVCGCSFCKACFKEYTNKLMKYKYKKVNKSAQCKSLFNYSNLIEGDKRKNRDDSDSDLSDNESSKSSSTSSLNNKSAKSFKRKFSCQNKISPFRCYNCNKEHDHNSTSFLKPNVLACKLTDKYWHGNIEIRKLRNDIRNYVCYSMESNSELFDVDKFQYMFEEAYKLDPSNHLILADLFLLNYFNGCNPNCMKYADMAGELRPNWPLAFYMKCVYYKNIGDFGKLKANLIQCLRLDPTLERLRIKLYLLFEKHQQLSISPSRKYEFNFESISTLKNDINDINLKSQKAVKQPQSLITEKSSDNTDANIPGKLSKTTESAEDQQEPRSTLTFDMSKYIIINAQLVKPIDLECSLCYRLLYKPVTTPCGHTFCCSCLDRSLDHQDKCPLCKNSLADYLAERRQHLTKFVDKLLRNYYPVEYAERKKQQQEELKEIISSENEIPVFVCTLALPFAPCPLHIYEPRYRLMLRRAIESGSKQFGMCMYSEKTPYRFTEYGCMLEIRSHQFTRDGRAVVATIGGRRFKVLNSSTKDGYTVAQVEWVKDIRVENEQEKAELQVLHDEVYRLALAWYGYIPEVQKNRIFDIYGMSELPEPEEDIQSSDNGPVWHWFLLNILPLENDFQYRFLTKTSLKDRLKQIKKIILVLMSPFVLERIRQMRGTNSDSPNPVNPNESNTNQNENASTNPNNEEEARANASLSNSDTLSNNSTVDNSNNDNPL